MAIGDLRVQGRKQVAWLGADPHPDGRTAFEDRKFVVSRLDEKDCKNPEKLAGLAAVVLTQSKDKALQVTRYIEHFAHFFLDCGCTIILRPIDAFPQVVSTLIRFKIPTANLPAVDKNRVSRWQHPDGDPPLPHAHIFPENSSWDQISNFVLENRTEGPPNPNLEFEVVNQNGKKIDHPFTNDVVLIMQRAFSDCKHVHLVEMPGGRSGMGVYRAYPELIHGHHGVSFPLPHFVKIGKRKKIIDEYKNYEDSVDVYVPFHLGPHLNRERCCLGARKGVLVGDYVEASESLIDCARTGRASAAIACLFDRTLHGWYRAAKPDQNPIAKSLAETFPKTMPPTRIDGARALGASKSLSELRALFEQCTGQPVLVGPVHGDLHAGNVRVRGNDAILIDFTAHRLAPVVYDFASLEASLLVEGFPEDDPKWDIKRWLQSVRNLYEGAPLHIIPPHANPKDTYYWFHECVRQIRHHAQRIEHQGNQYAAALAVALLVKAGKDVEAPEPESSRRAAAYLLAEIVLTQTFGTKITKAPAATERG